MATLLKRLLMMLRILCFFFPLLDHAHDATVQPNPRRKDMTDHECAQVYQALLTRSNNGKLRRKDTSIVAAQFGVHIRSVQRLWRRGKTQLDHNIPVVVTSTKSRVEVDARQSHLIWNFCATSLSSKE